MRPCNNFPHLFYAHRPPDLGKAAADSIKRFGAYPQVPVYYVSKIQNSEENEKDLPLELLYQKTGVCFISRSDYGRETLEVRRETIEAFTL